MFLFPAELGLHYCGGVLSIFCVGFSLRWLLLLQSTGSRTCGLSSCGSWALEHRLSSCWSAARGIFLDQGWNTCLLLWQVNSLPLSHLGSPDILSFYLILGYSLFIFVASRGLFHLCFLFPFSNFGGGQRSQLHEIGDLC